MQGWFQCILVIINIADKTKAHAMCAEKYANMAELVHYLRSEWQKFRRERGLEEEEAEAMNAER